MIYTIKIDKKARKQLNSLPIPVQNRIERKIDDLAQNPRPHGVEKLSGEENLYRVRIGDYRVIYQILDKILLVLIVKIGHRREVYR
ncbi:MAG: type II toxin-antitoxin system RelE/ParE family toxin [Deltaproteobacteria bacterium]